MSTSATAPITLTRLAGDLRATGPHRHTIVPRLIAGIPLFGIGLTHIFVPGGEMRPLVEAAGIPAAGLLSPLAVAALIVSGALLLLGAFARLGAVLAIPTMAVALYSHFAIEEWPNASGSGPPDALPIAVMVCAAYLLWRGAGRWSLDARAQRGR